MNFNKEKKEFSGVISMRMRESVGKKGIVLKNIYDKLGLSHTTMTNYMQGKSLPDLFVLKRFAKICDTTIGYLVNEDGGKTDESEKERLRSENEQLRGQISLLKEMLENEKAKGRK